MSYPTSPSRVPKTAEQAERRKKRRYASRSSEEVREEMDKRGVSYRIGWPDLPPLPVENAPHRASDSVVNSQAWLATARAILNSMSISFSHMKFAFRVPHNAKEDIDDITQLRQYLTLLFEADTIQDRDKIVAAITEIRMRFKEHPQVDHVMIECIDHRASQSIASHGIEYNEHGILDKWDLLRPILRELLEKNKCKWILLELLRRGLFDDPQKCPLTIVITTPTAGSPNWHQNIIPQILNATNSVSLYAQVEILAALDIVNHKKQKYQPSERVDQDAYKKVLSMGSSISIADKTAGTGTLGGSITLDDNSVHGLTNWHVVRDNRLDQIVSKTQGALLPGNQILANSPQYVLSPSTIDHEGRLGLLQVNMEQARQGTQGGEQSFNDAQAEFKRIEHWPRILGSVYAGSDCRTVVGRKRAPDQVEGKGKGTAEDCGPEFIWPMDWALVKVADIQKRTIENKLSPKAVPLATINALTIPTKLQTNQSCITWSNFNTRQHRILVSKYGRTSGWTFGKLNSAIVEFNGGDQISTAYGFTSKFKGSCFGVVDRRRHGEFLEPGDSGSILVHDPSGTQLGLLFASTTTEAYMIPHRLIFKDIKKITGKKVIQPEYIDPAKVGLASWQLLDIESD